MNSELKAYFDECEARRHRDFEDIMACMDALRRSMLDTTGCVTAVTASSGETELVTASARAVVAPAPAPSSVASPVVAPATSIDTAGVTPTFCLTECPSPKSTPTPSPTSEPTSPTATVDVIAVAAADCAAQTATVSAVLSPPSPTASATNGVVSIELAPDNDDGEHDDLLDDNSVNTFPFPLTAAISKPRPIPWPSFAGLPGGVHFADPRPPLQDCLTVPTLVVVTALNQNSTATVIPGTVDQEEQLTYLCANMNVLEDFLKKPCAEWEEAIWSGLISRATRAFKLWCIPWFRLQVLEMNSERVFQFLSEDNLTAVQHFTDSVPLYVHRFSFTLFQWDLAWQLAGSKKYAIDNLTTCGKLLGNLHTQIVFEKQARVVNYQLRPAWSPHVPANFSDLRSFRHLEIDATFPLFPWNPGGYLRGSSNQRNDVFPATNRSSQWLVLVCICDGFAMRSPFAILCDEWVLLPWDSGQQADFSYDRFSCANQCTSCSPGYFVCRTLCTQGDSVNCYLVQAPEQEKHLFDSADGQVPHMSNRSICLLQSKGDEMHQLITQPGKYLFLFLQPKPPWLFILTHPYAHVEEKGVHSHGEVMTLNSEIILAALKWYMRQLIGDCLSRTLHQEERYSSGNRLLSEAKLQGVCGLCEARTVQSYKRFTRSTQCQEDKNCTVEQLLYLVVTSSTPDAFHGGVCNGIRMERYRGSDEVFQRQASYLFGDCFPNNNTFGSNISSISTHSMISEAGLPVATMVIFCVLVEFVDKANPHWRSPWYPRGCMFALCSCEKWWTTSDSTALPCSDQLRQAHSQEGRNITNQAAFSDPVHVCHDYYIAFAKKISIGYDYLLAQAYYFKIVYGDLIFYHKGVRASWDPGKSTLQYPLKTSAWGQAEFQEGRNVMTLALGPLLGPVSWATNGGLCPPTHQEMHATNIHEEASMNLSSWITD